MDWDAIEKFRKAVKEEDSYTCFDLIDRCRDLDTVHEFKNIVESEGTKELILKLRL